MVGGAMIKRAVEQAIAGLAVGTRLRPVVRKSEAVVLRYCRVASAETTDLPRAVPEAEFAAQLRFLARRCRVLPLHEIARAVANGEDLPRGAVAITFDGGYEDNCSAAFPLLKEHGLTATFFIAAGWVESHDVLWWDRIHDYVRQTFAQGAAPSGYDVLPRPVAQVFAQSGPPGPAAAQHLEDELVTAVSALNLSPENTDDLVKSVGKALGAGAALGKRYDPMNWEQVAVLRDGGMTIGSHAMSDARLTAVNVDRAFEELSFSKKTLERKLGIGVDMVAYPEGSHNLDVADLAKEAGYRAAFTSEPGSVRPGDGRFALRRIDVAGLSADCHGLRGSFSPWVFGRRLRQMARRPETPAGDADSEA